MSYILDALRKSEQQRQAAETESATDRILYQQPLPSSPLKKWLAGLAVVNLLALGYFFGFVNKTGQRAGMPAKMSIPSSPAAQSESSTTAMLVEPEALVKAPQGNAPAVEPSANPQLLPGSPADASPSIAEMMTDENAVAEPTSPMPPLPVNKKPVFVKKPAANRAVANLHNPPNLARTRLVNHQSRGYGGFTEAEPRRTVQNEGGEPPKLTINVYSYAPQPEDRFVMINMTKYKVGQLIKDGIKLKEIHQDHIVLQQGGTTFKMDRP